MKTKKTQRMFKSYPSGRLLPVSNRCPDKVSCGCHKSGTHRCEKIKGHDGMHTTDFWPANYIG